MAEGCAELGLKGKRVVITRSLEQAEETVSLVKAAGGIPVVFPTIEIVPPTTWEPVDRALSGLGSYHWVIFTSVNGVRFFTKRMKETGVPISRLGSLRLCAIGPATSKALEDLGLKVDILPKEFVAESVLEALKEQGEIEEAKILLPRAEVARNTLPNGLKKAGALVDVVTVYRTVRANPPEELKREVLLSDVFTFSSPSTLVNFLEIMGMDAKNWLKDKVVACIGPVTKAKAEEFGVPVHVVPSEYTFNGLLRAVSQRLNSP